MTEVALPKISIVTACYNHANFVGETIDSILSQEYPNLEYVVIDDGSTDESWEVIKRYQTQLTHCERLEGYRDTPVTAINYSFKKTTGDIMMFINSDDVLLPKSLFVVAKIFQDHPQVEWLTGMATTINARSEIVNSKLILKHAFDYLISKWGVIQQESTFWKRSLWEKTGGYLNGEKRWAFDTELWTRFFQKAEHFHVATPIGAFRFGQQSKSVSDSKSFLEPNTFFLERFKKNASPRKIQLAYLYRICFLFRWILAPIPHRAFCHIPLLRSFCQNVFEYSNRSDQWLLAKKNPFRR